MGPSEGVLNAVKQAAILAGLIARDPAGTGVAFCLSPHLEKHERMSAELDGLRCLLAGMCVNYCGWHTYGFDSQNRQTLWVLLNSALHRPKALHDRHYLLYTWRPMTTSPPAALLPAELPHRASCAVKYCVRAYCSEVLNPGLDADLGSLGARCHASTHAPLKVPAMCWPRPTSTQKQTAWPPSLPTSWWKLPRIPSSMPGTQSLACLQARQSQQRTLLEVVLQVLEPNTGQAQSAGRLVSFAALGAQMVCWNRFVLRV